MPSAFRCDPQPGRPSNREITTETITDATKLVASVPPTTAKTVQRRCRRRLHEQADEQVGAGQLEREESDVEHELVQRGPTSGEHDEDVADKPGNERRSRCHVHHGQHHRHLRHREAIASRRNWNRKTVSSARRSDRQQADRPPLVAAAANRLREIGDREGGGQRDADHEHRQHHRVEVGTGGTARSARVAQQASRALPPSRIRSTLAPSFGNDEGPPFPTSHRERRTST